MGEFGLPICPTCRTNAGVYECDMALPQDLEAISAGYTYGCGRCRERVVAEYGRHGFRPRDIRHLYCFNDDAELEKAVRTSSDDRERLQLEPERKRRRVMGKDGKWVEPKQQRSRMSRFAWWVITSVASSAAGAIGWALFKWGAFTWLM